MSGGWVPCKVCGTPVHGAQDGRGYKLGKLRFVTCARHAEHVEAAADVARRVARVGVRTMLAQKAPKLLAVLDQAFDERRAEQHAPPIDVGTL